MSHQSFNGKTIWITGASSGIGEALSYAFAHHGARLVLSAPDPAALDPVSRRCSEYGAPHVLTEPFDISEHALLPAVAGRVLDKSGGIDILVNNAGIGQRAPAPECAPDVVTRILNVNFFGPVFLTQSILPSMLARGSGSIVVVASVLSRYHLPGRSAYTASKHALLGYFSTLRTELRNSGISVSIMLPGWITTGISRNALTADGSPYHKATNPPSRQMSAQVCARQIIRAISSGKPEASMGGIEIYGGLLRMLFPRLFDRLISRRSREFIR